MIKFTGGTLAVDGVEFMLLLRGGVFSSSRSRRLSTDLALQSESVELNSPSPSESYYNCYDFINKNIIHAYKMNRVLFFLCCNSYLILILPYNIHFFIKIYFSLIQSHLLLKVMFVKHVLAD